MLNDANADAKANAVFFSFFFRRDEGAERETSLADEHCRPEPE